MSGLAERTRRTKGNVPSFNHRCRPAAAFQVCAEKAKRLHRLYRAGGGDCAIQPGCHHLEAKEPCHLHLRPERLATRTEEGQILAGTVRTRRAKGNAPVFDHRCCPAAAFQVCAEKPQRLHSLCRGGGGDCTVLGCLHFQA
eukprot:scaffold47153_cov58-Phaeocystis_antarctica.AAC.3